MVGYKSLKIIRVWKATSSKNFCCGPGTLLHILLAELLIWVDMDCYIIVIIVLIILSKCTLQTLQKSV